MIEASHKKTAVIMQAVLLFVMVCLLLGNVSDNTARLRDLTVVVEAQSGEIADLERTIADQAERIAELEAREPVTVTIAYAEPEDEVESNTYFEDIPLSEELQKAVFDACDEYGIDPEVILGLIEVESDFQASATSSVGCYGLMQLNPSTFGRGLSQTEQIWAGAKYLSDMIDRFGSVHCGLVAYNCGPGGAQSNYFSQGLYSSRYSNAVMSAASRWADVIEGGI